MNDDAQPLIPLLSVLDQIETAAMMVRATNRAGGRRLVGMAPDGLRLVLESELIGVVDDVDRWLDSRDITITWYPTGTHGAVLDLDASAQYMSAPRNVLTLWPSAE